MSILRKSAKGRECTVRIHGICNHNPETTVLAHLNGGGMGMKQNDLFGCFACSSCHETLDGGYVRMGLSRLTRDLYHLQAMQRTQEIWLKEGLIKVVDKRSKND
ncbi:MAG: DUF1364 domain-containing protein [Candidatus Margulisiibacteriota bacterium]